MAHPPRAADFMVETNPDEALGPMEKRVNMALMGAFHAAQRMIQPEAVPRCFAELALALLVASVPTSVAHIIQQPRELWTARPQGEIVMTGMYAGDALPLFIERLVRGDANMAETMSLPAEVLYVLPEAETFSADDLGLKLIRDCLKREAEKAHTLVGFKCSIERSKSDAEWEEAQEANVNAARRRSLPQPGRRVGRSAHRRRSLSPTWQAPQPRLEAEPEPTPEIGQEVEVGPEEAVEPEEEVKVQDEQELEVDLRLELGSGPDGDRELYLGLGPAIELGLNLGGEGQLEQRVEPRSGLGPEIVLGLNLGDHRGLDHGLGPEVLMELGPEPEAEPVPPPNPLGAMFSRPLDSGEVCDVVKDILCSERVTNDRRRSAQTLKALADGTVDAETMGWVVRGLRTKRATRELALRHDGLEFLGPKWGAPSYKTGNGVGRLLRGVARKHGPGTKFMVCVSSRSGDPTNSATAVMTGVVSSDPGANDGESTDSSSAGGVGVTLDGAAGPGIADWVSVHGNMDDGPRLWAWVF